MEKGTVIKSTGSWYIVRLENEQVVECRIRGKFRMEGIRTTNPVAVGDWVKVEKSQDGHVIVGIEPRKNYLIRKSTNLSKESHIIASNIDQAILVVTINHPETSTVFIDRFLASTEAYNVPTILVFNKCDLYDEEEQLLLGGLKMIYEKIGYRCYTTSIITGKNIEQIQALLKDKISVFSGLSGVGKSSLINRLEPGLQLKTAMISNAHNSGKHTTTFAEMIPLKQGGYLIDTPGIRSFGMIDMKKEEISHYFREIFAFSEACRFNNCMHTPEPGCAVLEAIENGEISESRYASYLSMLEEHGKYRQ